MGERIFKRKYEHKLMKSALGIKRNREFLLAHLAKEWRDVERIIKKDRKRQKLYDTAKETGVVIGVTLLGMAAVCGILVVGAVAPKIFSVFGRSGKYHRYFDKARFNQRVRYFQRRGYIEVTECENEDRMMEIKLTELGKTQVVKRALGNLRILPQAKWDGSWRIVIFDIPERNKWAREGLRECLKRIGFYRLQKSAFVFPYPCRAEIEFLGRIYSAGGNIHFMEANLVSFGDELKAFFSLAA